MTLVRLTRAVIGYIILNNTIKIMVRNAEKKRVGK